MTTRSTVGTSMQSPSLNACFLISLALLTLQHEGLRCLLLLLLVFFSFFRGRNNALDFGLRVGVVAAVVDL